MGYLGELLAVLAVLYLLECLVLVPRDALVFWSRCGRGCRVTYADGLPGSVNRGVFLAMPLPPFGYTLTLSFWPISLSPDGISTVPAHQLTSARHGDMPEFIAFDSVQSARAEDAWLVINGRRLVRCVNAGMAARLAKLISDLRAAPQEKRGTLISEALAQRFDATAAAELWDMLKRPLRYLHAVASAMFLFVFVAFPLVVYVYGLSITWPYLVAGVLAFWLGLVVLYYRFHRACFPELKSDRRYHGGLMLLTPLAALRAGDTLSRERFGSVHPLVAGRLLCNPEAFAELAQDTLRDLTYPLHPDESTEAETALQNADWLRKRLRLHCEAALDAAGENVETLLEAPPRDDDTVSCYCPRCRGQFRTSQATCPDCIGIELVSFAALPSQSTDSAPGVVAATMHAADTPCEEEQS